MTSDRITPAAVCGRLERPESNLPWQVEPCGMPVDPSYKEVGAPPLCFEHLEDYIAETVG
jgi:hypothetical protein